MIRELIQRSRLIDEGFRPLFFSSMEYFFDRKEYLSHLHDLQRHLLIIGPSDMG